MANTVDLEKWSESQEYPVRLDNAGKIIDFLDNAVKRENTGEERIRQRMVQVIHFEFGYPKDNISLEKTIQMGRERKRADIVVYADAAAKSANDQGRILLIGEVKDVGVKEPDGQLHSYVSATSAQGGFWTNGNTIQFFRKNLQTTQIESWLGIPKYGFSWDSVGLFTKQDLIRPIDLKIVFRRCHNALYRAGIDSEDIALDIVRTILAKIEDESTDSEDCTFHITQEEFSDVKRRKEACRRVRSLFEIVRNRYSDVFNVHEEITASDEQLAIVISYLQPYSLLDAPYDVIGTAYEVYVASHLKGERGQYFTNRLVVNMMIRMLNPDTGDIILDPACGSGGFLIASMNHILEKIDSSKRNDSAKEFLKKEIPKHLFGIDTAPKLAKLAKANMLLSKDGHTGITRGNSLADFENLPASFLQYAGKGKPSVIVTNPPFGAGYELRIKETNVLENYQLGRLWSVDEQLQISFEEELNTSLGVPPEVLFMERCIEWVKPGGRIGIVMAKGQLDNREAFAMRHLMLHSCKILAVVNLHEDTFQPFVGAKASVILLEKKDITAAEPENMSKEEDYRIFMAISNKIGQTSRGEPIFKTDAEGNRLVRNNTFILDEDVLDIAQAYNQFEQGALEESAYRFSISRSELSSATLSLNPIQYLPAHNASLQHILSLGDKEEYELQTLGSIAHVFNGPRFKRPYADFNVTEGPTIKKYFTGTALTQLNSDNLKYLDESKANKQTKKQLEALVMRKGYILISDSGTLGRVTYALEQHDGHLATNNLIRVVIEDEMLRGYVYQFLKSTIGQHLMLKNAYGTNQEHLEPDVIANIPIPIPRDRKKLEEIGGTVLESIEALEKSILSATKADTFFKNLLDA